MSKKQSPKSPEGKPPIACHSRAGIALGARTVQTFRVRDRSGTPPRAHEDLVDEIGWHPLGVTVVLGGRHLVIPASRLDWIEVEGE